MSCLRPFVKKPGPNPLEEYLSVGIIICILGGPLNRKLPPGERKDEVSDRSLKG